MALNDDVIDPAEPFPSVHNYHFQMSAGGPREPGWTPFHTVKNRKADVRLQDLQGIQMSQEITISQS